MPKPKPVKKEVFNRTPFSMEEIKAFPLLGTTVNNWRQRNITLYAHPTESDKLVSVGVTFDGTMTVVAVEDRSAWKTALDYAKNGKVYVSQ